MFAPIEADSFESPLQHLIKCTFFSVTSQTTRICLTDIWRLDGYLEGLLYSAAEILTLVLWSMGREDFLDPT